MKEVLIVEDSSSTVEFLSFFLVKAGLAVTSVLSCEDALHILEGRLPNLILCDISFPSMSGLDFAKIVKGAERTKGIILIAVSAHALDSDRDRATAVGFDGYLTKPVNPRTFADGILSYLK